MTRTNRRDDAAAVRTLDAKADFDAELEALVALARDSEVDLEGAYDVRSPSGQPDYTVEISEVVRQSDHSLIE